MPENSEVKKEAEEMAIKAFAQGERWGGHVNLTTHPARWYVGLEQKLGDTPSDMDYFYLSSFNGAYNRKLAELGGDVESYWGLEHEVKFRTGAVAAVTVDGKKRSEQIVTIAITGDYPTDSSVNEASISLTEVEVMELMSVLRISLATLRNRINRP